MSLKSSVKAIIKDGKYILLMDEKINELRKNIWKTIFQEKDNLPISDVSMALSLVSYELVHHSDEKF